nr:hypothetical protein [Tanacetum cinerariifolium]
MFLSTAINSRFPPTNNQLKTSSDPRTQATIQDGKVTVHIVQGRQSQGYGVNTRKSKATGTRVINTIRDLKSSQPRMHLIQIVMTYLLSLTCSINGDVVGLTYDLDILFEVPRYNTYHETDMLNPVVQGMAYSKPLVFNNESYVKPTSDNNVISYADYIETIENDVAQNVPPHKQDNPMILFVTEQMKFK